jgi:hypothetical protein
VVDSTNFSRKILRRCFMVADSTPPADDDDDEEEAMRDSGCWLAGCLAALCVCVYE